MLIVAFIIIAALYAFHLTLIFHVPISDYDTVEIIRGSIFGDRHFRDIAHPYIHEFLQMAVVGSVRLGLSGKLGFLLVVAGALLFNLFSFACALGLLGVPWRQRAIAMILYLCAQATIDVAARAEENLLHHAIYIWGITAFVRLVSDPRTGRRSLVALINTVSLIHLNPFLLLVGSQALYITVSTLRGMRRAADPGLRAALMLSFRRNLMWCCAVPVLSLLLFIILAGVRIEPYGYLRPDMILSFDGNLLQWTRVYFLGAYTFVVLNLGRGAAALAIGIAMVALCVAYLLLLARRGSYPGCFGLTCLGFLYIFEPMSAERWDSFVVGLIIALTLHPALFAGLRRVLILALIVPFPLRADLYTRFPCKDRMWIYNEFYAKSFREKREIQQSIRRALKGRDTIYALQTKPTLDLIFIAPPAVRILPARRMPESGRFLFYSRNERELEEMRTRYRVIEVDGPFGLYDLIPRDG
ncbi:MAG: hypothetical protein PHN82_03955 [bacterium]|nr:hypothetical protein [bacterium]